MKPSAWERLKNDQRALAFLFFLPTLCVLASVVVYPVEDPVAVRQILAARRPAEPLGPGPPAPPGPRIAH